MKGGKKVKKMKTNRVRPMPKNINIENTIIGEIIKLLGDKRLSVKLENGKEGQAFFGGRFSKKGSQRVFFKPGDYLYLEEHNADESGVTKVYEVVAVVQTTRVDEAKEKINIAHDDGESCGIRFVTNANNEEDENEEDDIANILTDTQTQKEETNLSAITTTKIKKNVKKDEPFNFDDI